MALASGDSLGRYTVERLLGSGAMGEVHLARDPRIDRRVALKTLRVATVRPGEMEAMSERLLREARAAGRLIHPHIVTLFDAGEDDGLLYLAFEYVPGSDLAERLKAGPPLPLGEALRIAGETCQGLDHAHRQGIVHRDVKPSNLMLTADGRVKISDFGIAKLAGEAHELTVSGTVMGSPYYLSPEQVRGEALDGRSDLFSLGILLYEMIAGRRPFEGETLTTLVYQILHQNPPALPPLRSGLAPAVPQLLGWFLAKDRDRRVPDARTAGEALAGLAAALPRELLALPAVSHDEGTLFLDESAVSSFRTLPPPPPPPPPSPAAGGGLPGTDDAAAIGVPSAGVSASADGRPFSGSYAIPGRRPRSRLLWVGIAAGVVVLVGLALAFFLLQPAGGAATASLGAEPGAPPASDAVGGAVAGDRADAAPGAPRPIRGRRGGPGEELSDRAPGAARQPPAAAASAGGRGASPPLATVPPSPPAGGVSRDTTSGPSASPGDPPAGGSPGRATPPPAASPGAAGDVAAEEASLDTADSPRRLVGRPRSIGVADSFDETVASGMRLVLRVQPDDAYVLLDGTVVGQARDFSPASRRALDLPSAGAHTVVLRRAGMRDRTIRVEARADGPAVTPLVGRLLPAAAAETPLHELESHRVGRAIGLRVTPAGARVLVDGRDVGAASDFGGGRLGRGRWLELPLGMHRVSLVAPGHRRVDLAIDVTSGALEERKRIEITLPPLPPGSR